MTWLPFGKVIRNECIGMTVPEAVTGLEQADEFHVFQLACCSKDLKPMLHRLAILFSMEGKYEAGP